MSLRAWGIRSRSANTWQPARIGSARGWRSWATRPAPRWPMWPAGGVVKPVGEPTAITTLTPLDGADPQKVRSWLIAERGIVTTYAEVQRAPFELHAPVLRVSPHVDSATEDLEAFAEALAKATEQLS